MDEYCVNCGEYVYGYRTKVSIQRMGYQWTYTDYVCWHCWKILEAMLDRMSSSARRVSRAKQLRLVLPTG